MNRIQENDSVTWRYKGRVYTGTVTSLQTGLDDWDNATVKVLTQDGETIDGAGIVEPSAVTSVEGLALNMIEQFFCPVCREWLIEGGTVHDDGEHEGSSNSCASDWRYSHDGGATWQDEPRDVFNQALREWLNDRDYTSQDWPDNVPEAVVLEADALFGNGAILDEEGRPITPNHPNYPLKDPQKVWDGLSPEDQRRVRDFTPGIWDARSIFEEYVRLSDLFVLNGKVWRFTSLGASVSAHGRKALA